MQIRFWGTRGSIASPGPETLHYGGNTSCIEARTDDGTTLIFDCGTGARKLGMALAAAGPVRAHLLIGHTHADHIQGLPFFIPAFLPGSQITIYGPAGIDRDLPSAVGGQMEYAYFPVPLKDLPAKLDFVELAESEFSIGRVHVRTRFLNHTSPCLGYRIETGGVSFVYSTDHEPHTEALWRPERAPDVFDASLILHPGDRRHLELLRGADILVHDAQYTAAEYPSKLGWGHSTVEYAVDMAITAGVKRLVLFHHDPTRHDEAVAALLDQTRARAAAVGSDLSILAAAEGMVLELSEGPDAATAATAPEPPRTRGRARILVADDDTSVTRVLSLVLGQDGCQVEVAHNGADALQLAKERTFDLVLLDVQMPELDGYQTARAMRADQRLRETPIVMLTARGEREDLLAGFAEGVTDYMVKPIVVAQLRARVRAWLARTGKAG